ncbi:MAG: 16S rRNA (cytidine(1402)-2'-O)-methyltransferase [Candidatus Pelagibacter sp. TMED196]|nr:MAG: 16S rRNA (cytidine(1402)-2'-O)-methyltransferase [Candidatus Pelagibacter sp. TMED196]|tara:strand:+ start:2045 stop:2884 length:840 start_codon:yes stop_codon:yes gene_type:complete
MNNFLPGLYIVSTPIGNLEDITLRALNVLRNSDKILCEDTRRSIKLLNFYKIKKKLFSYHKFNEKKLLPFAVNSILKGEKVALISDAGTPILSDPGLLLLRECIKKKIKIFPIPGVSAITTATSVSGFNEKYFFYGFLPKKEKEIEKELNILRDHNFSIVFFVPSIKINYYIKFFKKYFANREILIAKEMTKIHEEFYRKNLKDFDGFKSKIKGELTVVLSNLGKRNVLEDNNVDKKTLKLEISKYLKRYSLRDVVNLISQKNKLPKKEIYDLCLKIKK